jgi:hypothetical protein
MGFWRFFKSVEKLLKKLLHDVSLLIDSSALRAGMAERPVDKRCEVDKFRALKLESEMPSSKRCSALGFFCPQNGE